MRLINDLNIKKQADNLGISIWYAPSFLFLVMGVLAIILMTAVYYISKNYNSPELVVVAESLTVSIIFIIGTSIIKGVEQIAKVNKLKSEFISVASHQLRTPLSAIKWETELLLSKRKDGLSEEQIKNIESIRSLSFRMNKLVSDLLDVAKIDQGKMITKKENVNIEAIVEGIIKEYGPVIRDKKIKIIFDKKRKASVFWSDSEKIKLLVDNLIGNAVKYISQRGKIEIKIKCSGGFMFFSVKDNGVGIPKEQQNQIFNKFFRSDNAVKYQTDGTGLGLYIAKNVIEQLGGKIWFQSKEGIGSVFNFVVPLANKK